MSPIASAVSHPSSRRAAWLLTAPLDQLKAPELRYVEAICTESSALAAVHSLAMEFHGMLKTHDPNVLALWLDTAERSELRSLAACLRRDKDAVLAAILFRWSNGQVEGQVNRLQLIKRTMYARCTHDVRTMYARCTHDVRTMYARCTVGPASRCSDDVCSPPDCNEPQLREASAFIKSLSDPISIRA